MYGTHEAEQAEVFYPNGKTALFTIEYDAVIRITYFNNTLYIYKRGGRRKVINGMPFIIKERNSK